jgi:hypothetical protein
MSDQARRGRTIVIAIIAWYFLTNILSLVLGLGSEGPLPAVALALLVLELVLFYFLYAGRNWARWLMGILSVLLWLFEWWLALFIRDFNLAGILVFLCFGSTFLLAAGLLFFSPAVGEYFARRNSSPTSKD